MLTPTFSTLDLLAHCQYPWLSGLKPRKSKSGYASFGTCVHTMAQCLAVWGDAPVGDIAEGLDDGERDRLISAYAAIDEYLSRPGDEWRMTEVPVALNLRTGRARTMQLGGKRRYRLTADERGGTLDLVRMREGVLHYTDYKTGWYRRFTDPIDDLQLLAGGVAVARIFDADKVVIEFCHVDDDVTIESAELDAIMLDWAFEKVSKVYALLDDWRNAVPKPGMHCKDGFCKVVGECPATTAATNAALQVSRTKFPLVPQIESDEQARFILERLPAIKEAVKQIETAMKERYASAPLDLGDGRRWAAVEGSRDKIVVNEHTKAILRKALGSSYLESIISEKITKTDLAKAIKDVAPPRGAAALQRTIMEELEGVDALQRSTFTSYKVIKVKE